MGAGLKHLRLGLKAVGVALEKLAEEGEFDLLPIMLSGLHVEIDVSHPIARAMTPLPMGPGSHHQQVGDSRVELLGPSVGFQGSEEVFAVEPSAHGQYRTAHVLEVGADVAGLPVGVVVRVIEELRPDRDAFFEMQRLRVSERSHPQEEVVTVGVVEHKLPSGIPQGIFAR